MRVRVTETAATSIRSTAAVIASEARPTLPRMLTRSVYHNPGLHGLRRVFTSGFGVKTTLTLVPAPQRDTLIHMTCTTVTTQQEFDIAAERSDCIHVEGNTKVRAYGSATVTAYDSATVTAYDSATVTTAKS